MAEVENKELILFYNGLKTDVVAALAADEEGSFEEFKFTQIVLDILSDAGETENARQCHDVKINKAGQIQHKVSGYALGENNETLDLFVTVYKDTSAPEKIYKDSLTTAQNQVLRFLKNSLNRYFEEIEETSPVFELAQRISLIEKELVRINIFILTNGLAVSSPDSKGNLKDILVNYHVRDVRYLQRLSESKNKRIPIEIDFVERYGGPVKCISMPSANTEYEAYLAVISGETLAAIYEEYGSRLLEQNVRSFLQFTGKINKGMRDTILNRPHMFLAYNNGIAATAEQIVLSEDKQSILFAKDLQIVNGGQTTASIFHTKRKDKKDVSDVFVQMKLSVIKDAERISDIVSKIAEYANTQNRVKPADLTSNNPFHVEFEKLSRTIWAPPAKGQNLQTRWFYERARGQYKDALNKELTTGARKQFELKNPKTQMFAKEDLAKFFNSWELLPHQVAVGREKCYSAFVATLKKEFKPDSIYFEDSVAKGIMFKAAEKEYGVGANSIASKDNIRSFVVPYSLSWLRLNTDGKLDLFKIWKNQCVSPELSKLIKDTMIKVDKWLNSTSASRNIRLSDWVRREECWNLLKAEKFNVDLASIKPDFVDPKQGTRYKKSEEDIENTEKHQNAERLKEVPVKIWQQIEDWGRSSQRLTTYQCDILFHIRGRITNKKLFSETELSQGIIILDLAITEAPELFYNIEEIKAAMDAKRSSKTEFDLEIVKELVKWDRKNKRLKVFEFQFMLDLSEGKKSLSDYNKAIAQKNLDKAVRLGFTKVK